MMIFILTLFSHSHGYESEMTIANESAIKSIEEKSGNFSRKKNHLFFRFVNFFFSQTFNCLANMGK